MVRHLALTAVGTALLVLLLILPPEVPFGELRAAPSPPTTAAEYPGARSSQRPKVRRPEDPEDSKLNTEDATPVDPGDWELQFLYTRLRGAGQWGGAWDHSKRAYRRDVYAGFEASYGVHEGFDVAVGVGYLNLLDLAAGPGPVKGSGIGDSYVLPKISLSGESRTRVAFLPGLGIPTGSTDSQAGLGTGQGYWSFMPELALTRPWGEWTSNAALFVVIPFGRNRGSARGALETDLSIGRRIRTWLQPEAEVNYVHDFSQDGADSLALTAGLVLPVSEHFRATFGAQQVVLGRNVDQTTSWTIVLTPILGKPTP